MVGVTQTTLPDTSWLSDIKSVITQETLLFDTKTEKQAFHSQSFFLHAIRTRCLEMELAHTKTVEDKLKPRMRMFQLVQCSFPQEALDNYLSKMDTDLLSEKQKRIIFEASVISAVTEEAITLLSADLAEIYPNIVADFVFAAGFRPVEVCSPRQFALDNIEDLAGYPMCDFCFGFGKHNHDTDRRPSSKSQSWRVCESCGGRAHTIAECPFDTVPYNSKTRF